MVKSKKISAFIKRVGLLSHYSSTQTRGNAGVMEIATLLPQKKVRGQDRERSWSRTLPLIYLTLVITATELLYTAGS